MEWASRVNLAHWNKDERTKRRMIGAREAHKRIMMTAHDPWQRVCGRATATMAALIGIGWKPLSYKAWMFDEGKMVNIDTDILFLVKHKVNCIIERKHLFL